MSNSNPAHRIGTYEGIVEPETYLGDCQDMTLTGLQSCRADLEVVLSGAEEAEGLIKTLQHAEERLDKAKSAMRHTAKIDVPALADARLAALTDEYTRQLREAVKAARQTNEVTETLVQSARAIARISKGCHVLAERLVPALTMYVERQEALARKKAEAAKTKTKPAKPKAAPAKHAPAEGVDEPTERISDDEIARLHLKDADPEDPLDDLVIDMGWLDEPETPKASDTRITKA